MNTATRRSPYADWLRERMEERGVSTRGLAKLVNPERPDLARRAIRRHLKGTTIPMPETRRVYARALGSEDIGPDEDTEDD